MMRPGKEVKGASLDQSWVSLLNAYRAKKVSHDNLVKVTEDIFRLVVLRSNEGFILIVGPTRVGKTTVCDSITAAILMSALDEMKADPGYIPIACMEATAYSTRYNWRDHWVGCLQALNEPLIDKKIDYTAPRTPRPRLSEGMAKYEREATLRRSFETSATLRRLRAFAIDEAQHLTLVPARAYRSQIEIIKSVASKSGALHLLFGTYDLLHLRNASGQLGARAATVHFRRYRPVPDELKSFAEAARSLILLMPFPEPPDLIDNSSMEYLFETSLGCIGLLKVWFVDALGAALEAGKKTLTIRDLERHAFPIDVREKISKEIVDGERALEEDPQKLHRIRTRLRDSNNPKAPGVKVSSTDGHRGSTDEEQKPRTSKASRRRPGERNPTRDPVGISRKRLRHNHETEIG